MSTNKLMLSFLKVPISANEYTGKSAFIFDCHLKLKNGVKYILVAADIVQINADYISLFFV